jgi:hypothetical protein
LIHMHQEKYKYHREQWCNKMKKEHCIEGIE